jgi:hypothetical protein
MTNVAVMPNEEETVSAERRSRIAGVVLASIAVVVMGLLNLPYDFAEVEGKWIGGLELEDRGEAYMPVELPRMAGWPVRYSVEYGEQPVRELRYWSTPGLLVNIGFTLCLAAGVYGFLQLRSRRTSTALDQGRTRKLFDVCIASAILLVPLAVVAWGYRTAYLHQRLASRLAGSGNAYMSCWLPKPIADQVPGGLMQSFRRLRTVQIVAADQHGIDRLVDVSSLVSLHCLGGDFDSSAIDRLGNKIHFSSLRLYGRSLSDADLEAIAKLRWLTVLDLSRSNLDGDMLRRLDGLQRLTAVNLRSTPLPLAELGQPQWSATVQELNLSRPRVGIAGSLDIDGWPLLRRLSITRNSVTLNASPLAVRLANLPALEQLHLDRVQKHSLALHNVPRLSRIEDAGSLMEILMGTETSYPGQTWVDRLEIDGADSLTEIGCFVRDLQSMSIRGVPNLRRIALSSYLETMLGSLTPQPVGTARCQRWIHEIGALDGPGDVDFFGLNVVGSDLSPLVGNSRIRHLRLGASGISFQQVRELEGMQQLESLDLGACPLEEDQLSWILDTFSKLEKLTVNGASLARFDPTGRQHLRTIRTSPLDRIEDIRIVDLPLLKTFIATSQTPQRMEIRNAQSLRGLIIEAPWPKNYSISGLRDLECFLGGGEAIDDEVMEVILQCRKLDQLTLAYTSISPDKLRETGQLYRLSVLALPGAEIDDEVTSHWRRLTALWDLNLDDTSISVATIAWASNIEPLRRLSLNRVELNAAAIDALGELRQLSELHLAGTAASIEKLKPLFQAGNLEVLNLSGQRVDSEFIDALATADSLRHLILHGSDVDAESLQRMLASNPSLYIELGGVPEFDSEDLAADLNRRALLAQRHLNSGWRHLIQMRGGTRWRYDRADEKNAERDGSRLRTTVLSSAIGMIDRQVFRPSPLEGQSFK